MSYDINFDIPTQIDNNLTASTTRGASKTAINTGLALVESNAATDATTKVTVALSAANDYTDSKGFSDVLGVDPSTGNIPMESPDGLATLRVTDTEVRMTRAEGDLYGSVRVTKDLATMTSGDDNTTSHTIVVTKDAVTISGDLVTNINTPSAKINGAEIATQTYANTKVASVTGTANRITSTGGTTPIIDISASYVGQASITMVGTIGTGTWQGTAITDTYISSAATWNAKQAAITGAATTITTADLTASRVLVSNGSGKVAVSSVTSTTLAFLDATSSIQNQLNNLAIGIGGWKTAARVLTASNITISSPGSTVDSVTMAVNDRVVLNGQSTGSQNGVYVWNGAAVPMTRATDCTTGDASNTGVLGMVITIEEGTYADQFWVCTTNAPITIGSTTLSYAKGSATTYTGSNGITLTGNNFTLDNSYFTGDVTVSAGSTTIGAGKVTNTMLAGSIDLTTKITGILPAGNGGTGVANNAASTWTISGNFGTTVTVTATTAVTLPTSGTLYGTKSGSITSAQMLASMSDPTGTGASVFGTSPTFVTQITTPLVQGGTGAASQLDLRGTNNGSVTTTAIAVEHWIGNSGTTSGMRLYQDNQLLVGTPSATLVRVPNALSIFRVGVGTSIVDVGESQSGVAAIWFNQTTPGSTNYGIRGNSTTTNVNASSSVTINIANNTRVSVSNTVFTITPAASTSGVAAPFMFTGPASTLQTAGSESISVNFDLTATIQHASNTTISLQRDVTFKPRTHSFATASGGVMTDVATIATSAPISGTNATPVNVHGILVETGNVDGAGAAPTNSYGITSNAMTGATNNYSAQFVGGLGVYMSDVNIVLGTTTGTKIGSATSQKLGFWNATPIIQPASANQAALTNNTTGAYDGILADVGVVFSQAAINNNFTDVYTLLTEIRTALVNSGLMKGAA